MRTRAFLMFRHLDDQPGFFACAAWMGLPGPANACCWPAIYCDCLSMTFPSAHPAAHVLMHAHPSCRVPVQKTALMQRRQQGATSGCQMRCASQKQTSHCCRSHATTQLTGRSTMQTRCVRWGPLARNPRVPGSTLATFGTCCAVGVCAHTCMCLQDCYDSWACSIAPANSMFAFSPVLCGQTLLAVAHLSPCAPGLMLTLSSVPLLNIFAVCTLTLGSSGATQADPGEGR